MNNSSEKEVEPHSDHSNYEDAQEIKPLLSITDFNGDGKVDNTDVRDIIARYEAVEGDDLYHPLYDTNVNGEIDNYDIENTIHALGEDVPLLDQQIAQVTQATMKYYGSGGLENAIADGYLTTLEVKGHGIHYLNPTLANEFGNLEELDIERPVGLNYDAEGNLLAVFYGRFLEMQEATPENPLGDLFVNPVDDYPPSSFDTLTADDWHNHQSVWITGLGSSLNSESVHFEEDVPVEAIVSRLQDTDFQLFPESDIFYSPKMWMIHGWFHSLNPAGTFGNLDPNVGIYAPEELGVHGGHDHGDSDPLIAGTDKGEQLFGTERDDQINGFGGDDQIAGRLGDDLIWGSHGDDSLRGDDGNSSEGGNDMVYGGPGNDLIYGNAGDDRLFGFIEDDIIVGGEGDDLLRGGLGYDVLTGNEGEDTFVLAPNEGTDIITDLEPDLDTIVLYAGITKENMSIEPVGEDTALGFKDETLAIVSGINASDLMVMSDDIFLVA